MAKVFVSGSWFSPEEKKHLTSGLDLVKANKSIAYHYWCLDPKHQPEDVDITTSKDRANDPLWIADCYKADIMGIKRSDVFLALVTPGHGDTGMAQEQGYAVAIGKPIIVCIPDEDYDNPTHENSLNVMIAASADAVIPLRDLHNYNFDCPEPQRYKGYAF